MKNTDKKISMQTIADKLGVTKVTVYRALNNIPGVSDRVKSDIIKCADELGYQYSKRTVNKYTGISDFAYIVPQHFLADHDRFYSKIYEHIQMLCNQHNIRLILHVMTNKDEEEANIPPEIFLNTCSGVFFAGFISSKVIIKVKEKGKPIVLIDHFHHEFELDSILSDNYYMGYVVACYLIEKGHENIGFVGDYNNIPNIADRFLGLQKALIKNRLPIRRENYIINDDWKTGLYTLNFRLPDPLPTAFVCHCDMAAYYLYEKLKLSGYSIPDDVSVISFDDTDIAETINPKLTSIYSSRKDFAELAFRQMVHRINYPDSMPEKNFIPFSLAERDSVKDIRFLQSEYLNRIKMLSTSNYLYK